MKNKLVILAMVLLMLTLAAGATKLFAADEDAFAILAKLEKNYIGLEKPGLETLMAKAVYSGAPEVTVLVYWAKDKGLKTKAEGNTPNTMIAKGIVDGFVKMNGLGREKASTLYKLNKENVTGTWEATTLNGTKFTQLTFIPIPDKDKKSDFTKMIMLIDTNDWTIKQTKVIDKGVESVSDFEYKDGLIAKMTSIVSGITTAITNTYTTVDKFIVPAKMEMGTDGKGVMDMMKHFSITYSEVKVNVKIPDEIFAMPKTGDVPKPTENAAELFKQAQTALMKGDMDTARLKLKQIITYYPDDPNASMAKMMLDKMPK
jgi:hypothetical protein